MALCQALGLDVFVCSKDSIAHWDLHWGLPNYGNYHVYLMGMPKPLLAYL